MDGNTSGRGMGRRWMKRGVGGGLEMDGRRMYGRTSAGYELGMRWMGRM